MASKSSHSPRAGRRRPTTAASLKRSTSRNRSRPAPKSAAPAPAKPAAGPENGAEVKPSLVARAEGLEVKRDEPVRVERIPIARPFRACPRCDNNHESLEVKRLTRAADGFSHFAMCPNLGEPILIAMGGA